MAFEVAKLGKSPGSHNEPDYYWVVGVLIRIEVKLNTIAESEKNPVMERIDKHSFEGHGSSAEDVNVCSL